MKVERAQVHFIVCRSRSGWAVNVDADRLSDHASLEEARLAAQALTECALESGCSARYVDLSDESHKP